MARERTTAVVMDMDDPDDEYGFDEEPVDVRLELAGVPFN